MLFCLILSEIVKMQATCTIGAVSVSRSLTLWVLLFIYILWHLLWLGCMYTFKFIWFQSIHCVLLLYSAAFGCLTELQIWQSHSFDFPVISVSCCYCSMKEIWKSYNWNLKFLQLKFQIVIFRVVAALRMEAACSSKMLVITENYSVMT
jgi:hypothetical protein